MGLIRNSDFTSWQSDSQPSDWIMQFVTCEKLMSAGDSVCLIRGREPVYFTTLFCIYQDNYVDASSLGYYLQIQYNLCVNDGTLLDKDGRLWYGVELIVGATSYFLQDDGTWSITSHVFDYLIDGIKEEDGLRFKFDSLHINNIPYDGILRVYLGQPSSMHTKVRGSIFSSVDIIQSTFNDLEIIAVNTTKDSGSGGTATINANGSNTPIKYSLDGLTYQSSNVFSGFSAGSYTAYAKDSLGNVVTRNFAILDDYPYGEWIRSTIVSPAGLVFVASVYKRNYSGSVLVRAATDDMLTFDFPGKDDDYAATFKGRSAILTILTEDADDFSDIFADDRSCYVRVTLGGTDYFKGYVLINDTAKPYLDPFKTVSIQARCGIGELKEHKFLDESGNKFRLFASIKDILILCLSKLDLGLKLRLAFNLFEDDMSSGSCPLEQAALPLVDFYEGEDVPNCYDILEEILTSFNSQILMSDCRWYVIRNPERTAALKCWEYNADGSYSAIVTINKVLAVSGRSVLFKADQAVLQKTPAYRNMTVSHEYKLRQSIVPNGDMSQYDENLVYESSRLGGRYVNKRSLLIWQAFIKKEYVKLVGTRQFPVMGGSNEAEAINRSYIHNRLYLAVEPSQSFTLELMVTPLSGGDITVPVQLIMGTRSFSGTSNNWEPNLTSFVNYTSGKVAIPALLASGYMEVRVYCSDRVYSLEAFNLVLLESSSELPEARTYSRNINSLSRYVPDQITVKVGDAPYYTNAGLIVKKALRLTDGSLARGWGKIGSLVDNLINFYAELMQISRFRLDCVLITTSFDSLTVFVDDLGALPVCYMFNGGTYLASIDEWEVQLLEIHGSSSVAVDRFLMIDEGNYLLIDDAHKLIIG